MKSAKQIEKSPTLVINEKVNQLRAEGKQIFSFGLGQSPFPVPAIVTQELIKNAHQKDYLQVQGLKSLRQAVADFHRREDGIICDADAVLIGPGSKELIFQLMLCFEGEVVLVTPCWVTYYPQAQVLNKRVHFIETTLETKWKLQPAALDEVSRKNPHTRKLLILNYPSNPCGNSYTREELAALATVAKRNNILILSDEIYGQVNFKDVHASIASAYPEGTIVSTGLSKWCGAGGWRLGTFRFPQQEQALLDQMISIASETFTAVSAPIQFAAIAAFKGGSEIDGYLIKSRMILAAIGDWIYERLLGAGVRLHKPVGGFYVFPDFENFRKELEAMEINTSAELCALLLSEIGLASLPGSVFSRPANELTLRLSFVSFDGGIALKASDDLILHDSVKFIEQYCPEVFQGINRLATWLQNFKRAQ